MLTDTAEMPDFEAGDILVWPGRVYQHWGVHVGDGIVVHYTGQGSSVCKQMSSACIEQSELDKEDLKNIRVWRTHADPEDQRRVVERAKSRIEERSYNIASNNCEHFAKWCAGESSSAQVGGFVKSAVCAAGGTILAAAFTGVQSGLIEPAIGIGFDNSPTVAVYFTMTVLPASKFARTFTVLEGEGPVGLVLGGGALGLAGLYGAYKAYQWLQSED